MCVCVCVCVISCKMLPKLFVRVMSSCILSPSPKAFTYFFWKEEKDLGKDAPGEPWPPPPKEAPCY